MGEAFTPTVQPPTNLPHHKLHRPLNEDHRIVGSIPVTPRFTSSLADSPHNQRLLQLRTFIKISSTYA